MFSLQTAAGLSCKALISSSAAAISRTLWKRLICPFLGISSFGVAFVAHEPQFVAVAVHPSLRMGAIHSAVLGVNDPTVFNGLKELKALASALKIMGITGSRWPGGTWSDAFDWQSAALIYCSSIRLQPREPDGTFDNYMKLLVLPNGLSPEITVNYATSGIPKCSGAGDPAHAAAWVSYANVTRRYGIKWWEVGNEVYEAAEPDNHPGPHTPESYALYEPAFYSAMKAVDPSIKVGIPVTAGSHGAPSWDGYVLSNASYDYVIYHYYPEFYPDISDSGLLAAPLHGPYEISKIVRNIRLRLEKAGKCTDPCASFPISISEWNSVSHNPTPQTFSIVEGLFVAESLGEFFNAGVARAEFWSDWAAN